MLRVLHLAHDHVSVRRVREQIAERPGEEHQWLMCGGQEDGQQVRVISPSDPVPDDIRLAQWDAVVVHRMRKPTPRWVLSIPDGPMFVWATWGDDYYRVFPALSRGVYLPKSRLLLGAIGKFSIALLGAVQAVRRALFPASWMMTPRDWELKAMARVEGIANWFESDFVALPHLPRQPEYLYPTWYNAVPAQVPDLMANDDPDGPILLGSSASTTGNQLDFLWDHAPAVKASGRTVRMVMAYGSGRYAKALQVLGKWKLGAQLEWLDHKLPLAEYIAYLAECPVVVHNQIRNQNTGNAVLSFLLGHRVLMRSETLMHEYFAQAGFRVGDASAEVLDLSPLPHEDRVYNRNLALKLFGHDAVMNRFDVFVAEVKNRHRGA